MPAAARGAAGRADQAPGKIAGNRFWPCRKERPEPAAQFRTATLHDNLPRELAQQLRARFGESDRRPGEFRGEMTVKVPDAARIAEVCAFAKAEPEF